MSRYERFFSLSNDMLCIVGHDGRFQDVNSTWGTTLGYARDEIVGRRFADFVHPDDLARTKAASAALVAGDELGRFENRYRCRDGSYRWLEWLSTPSKEEGVSYSVARDITERVELEARLQEANRARADFVSHMSHELRTPLNAVLGFTELLRERAAERLEPRELQYLSFIQDGGTHLLRLINEVLDLARVEAGKIEFHLETLRLDRAVSTAISATELSASQGEIEFVVDVEPGLVVGLDPGRLEQVLLNLLSNAVKFTPAGGRVTLRARADGDDLLITVEDTGIGIPVEAHDRVFKPFERPNEGRATAGGAGIGLSLTKQLVELQGGAIEFASAAGMGTVFSVRLPQVVRGALRGHRLLIIEDEAHSAQLIAEHAVPLGLGYEVVGSVAAGIASMERDLPAGVVLDLRLPDVPGEEFLRQVKARPDLADVPVLVASVDEDITGSVRLGADVHLVKPVHPELLLPWLRKIAERSRHAHPAG